MHTNRLSDLPTLEHATYNCPWKKQSVFRSIPHYSNDCPWALLMVIANRTFPVSPSSFIYPPVPPGVPVVVVSLCPGHHLYSLCPGRHLCPGVPVCNFSLSVPVVIYIPCVPVVICVPVSRSVIRQSTTTSWQHTAQSCNDVSRRTWHQSTHKHDVSQQTDTNKQLIFIYIDNKRE